MIFDNNQRVFFALLRAGLWEQDVRLLQFGEIDYSIIYKLAEEQSVVGLIAAGLEHVIDTKVPKEKVLPFVGMALQLEQRNTAMNRFIGVVIDEMRKKDIYALLVKGQGIAQCYERPLWRACGDVDFLLSEVNYNKAYEYLVPKASSSRVEGDVGKHQELIIDSWVVELHGDLKNGLSRRMDLVLSEIQRDVFYGGNVRSWQNEKTQMFLLGENVDAVFVFSHIIKHLFLGGIGLRQVCDWCRLLWVYRDSINYDIVESCIRRAGLISEWRTLASLVVDTLGMPMEAMPFYSLSNKWKEKSERVLSILLESGNFGHNKDVSYQSKYSGIIRKFISFYNQARESYKLSRVFPFDAFRFFVSYTVLKTRKAIKKQ